jgi:hypothetical protein
MGFVTVLSSSVRGELERHVATSRRHAFSIAHQVLAEQEVAELALDPAPLHGETLAIKIEGEVG